MIHVDIVIGNWYKVSTLTKVVKYNNLPSLYKINNLAIHEHASMIYLTQRAAPLASVSEAHRHR